MRVALELDVILTRTVSPMRCVPLSNTTTLFCEVRPKSLLAAALAEAFHQYVELAAHVHGVSFGGYGGLQLYHFVEAAQHFTSSGTSSGRCFEAYVPGRSLYLNMKAES